MKKNKTLENLKNECFKFENNFTALTIRGRGGWVVDSHQSIEVQFGGEKYKMVALDSKMGSGFSTLWY
ncbi:MAG: hypothetical protein IPJ81_04555 [Chitinophagaceae bacterium]|nr:hypothetical protein [Chitinophagaceae bacterium]